jgi:hypothetical protein
MLAMALGLTTRATDSASAEPTDRPAAPATANTTPAAPPAPAPPPPGTIRIAAAGHVVFGSDWPPWQQWLPPDDGVPIAAAVAPIWRDADLRIANLGVPMTTHPTPRGSRDPEHDFIMRTPPRYGAALRALGLDIVLAANNHSLDFGRAGHAETLAHLEALGIDALGPRGRVVIREVRGVRVAFVGFTQPYVPEFQSHTRIPEAGALIADVAAHADIVIAFVHGGGEGRDALYIPHGPEFVGDEFRGNLVKLARHLIDSGADAVIGVGAHHPRAMEFHNGRLIAYALGNFVTWGNFDLRAPNHLSLVLHLDFHPDGTLAAAQLTPVRLRHPGAPFADPLGWTIPFLRRLSRASFPASAPRFHRDGRITPR